MRPLARLGLVSAIAGIAGCLFTADFDRFDTSPAVEVTDAGPPAVIGGMVALRVVGSAPVIVRPEVPGTLTVRAERSGNAPASGVRVRLENAPPGLTATDAVIPAGANEATITVTVASPTAIAPLLGRTADIDVVGVADDATVTSVSSSSVTVEVWGTPGQVDPTRGAGALTFDTSKVTDDTSIGNVPTHIGDFSGTTLAVGVADELLTLDASGKASKSFVGVPDAGVYVTGASVLADGDDLVVVTTRIAEVTLPFVYEGLLRRGPVGALVPRAPFPAGFRCSIDREGRRAACKEKVDSSTYRSPLRRLDGANPGQILRSYDSIDPITILHGARGWLLAGLRLATPASPTPGQFVELLDDDGQPVSTFAYAGTPGGLYDAIIDDDGVVVGGFDTERALVGRRTWSGVMDPGFATGKLVRLPGDSVVRLAATPRGLLAATATYPTAAVPVSTGRLARLDPKTGALDPRFGDKGIVTVEGYAVPIAMKDTGTRILVALLTSAGARVVHLFP